MKSYQVKKLALRLISILGAGLTSKAIRLLQQSIGFGYDSGIQNEVKIFSIELSKFKIEKPVILDVGANLGEWSKTVKTYFPKAEIHAFEPSKATFLDLVESLRESENVSTYNFGLGEAEQSQLLFYENEKKWNGKFVQKRFNPYFDRI
jgi:hypothetical protein